MKSEIDNHINLSNANEIRGLFKLYADKKRTRQCQKAYIRDR